METEQRIDDAVEVICDMITGLLGRTNTLDEIKIATDLTKALAELISARAEVAKLPRKACQ